MRKGVKGYTSRGRMVGGEQWACKSIHVPPDLPFFQLHQGFVFPDHLWLIQSFASSPPAPCSEHSPLTSELGTDMQQEFPPCSLLCWMKAGPSRREPAVPPSCCRCLFSIFNYPIENIFPTPVQPVFESKDFWGRMLPLIWAVYFSPMPFIQVILFCLFEGSFFQLLCYPIIKKKKSNFDFKLLLCCDLANVLFQ